MMVCAHGDVADYCTAHEMTIYETWDGDIREYRGVCRVVVTDCEMSRHEYYYLKGEMLATRGIELVSTRWKDDTLVAEYIIWSAGRRSDNRRGRPAVITDEVKARVIELKAAGMSLRMIREDGGVRTPRGGKLSISTISNIIRSKMKDE